jgi:hypothetical protein
VVRKSDRKELGPMQQVYAKRKQKKAALIPRDIDPLRLFEQFRQFGVVALPALGRARGPLQCAVRSGKPRKGPAGFCGASSLQGLKTRDTPRAATLTLGRSWLQTSFLGGGHFCDCLAFSLQHARGNPSTVTQHQKI